MRKWLDSLDEATLPVLGMLGILLLLLIGLLVYIGWEERQSIAHDATQIEDCRERGGFAKTTHTGRLESCTLPGAGR